MKRTFTRYLADLPNDIGVDIAFVVGCVALGVVAMVYLVTI